MPWTSTGCCSIRRNPLNRRSRLWQSGEGRAGRAERRVAGADRVSEASKARELEHLLQLRAGVHESQVILAHTPLRMLGASRPDETRLVVGKGSTPEVA